MKEVHIELNWAEMTLIVIEYSKLSVANEAISCHSFKLQSIRMISCFISIAPVVSVV